MPFGRRRPWILAALVVLIAYAAGIAVLCIFPDRLILAPSKNRIRIAGEARRLIATPVGKIEIWTTRSLAARNQPSEGYVLAFNGNASRAERELPRIDPMWSKEPVEIWAMNYPGYGGSEGKALMKNIPPAALAVYDALAKLADGKPIFLSGHSLGTTVALGVAARRPVAGLVLHNPPPLEQLLVGRFGWFNLWIAADRAADAVPPGMNSLTNAPQCHEPTVFLLAGNDTLVPPKYQQMVVAAYAGPKDLVHLPGYSHNKPVLISPILGQAEADIAWMWNLARHNLPH
jgi:alpha-beta hydrolase superfamily lysophospholipase